MRRIVRAEYFAPIVRLTAENIVRGAGAERRGQVGLLRSWLIEHTRFVRDPIDLERVVTPKVQLARIRATGTALGDCDDVAVLAAALGMAVGLRARFVVIGRAPHRFEHVFTVLGDGRRWWELDITRSEQGIPATMTNSLTVEV